ncbi:MAG: Cna B-type domain-containing protein [Clostridia bacterium]|nr:Cna B-type domain-containing protein [Clostridia bacterium]
MKLSARRILALLLAIVLTGVFSVRAETYVEYSGGLSVADVRAANGDTTVYVCINGTWEVAGSVTSGSHELTYDNKERYFRTAQLSDVSDTLVSFGFSSAEYSPADKSLAYSLNDTYPNVQYQNSDWNSNRDYVPLSGAQRKDSWDDSNTYALYYTPNWASDISMVAVDVLAGYNSFYTITVTGLEAGDAAAVSYGDAYNTDYGRLVFNGNDATITVPAGADYDWTYSDEAGYGSVTRTETDAGTVFTFTDVTAPLTLTAAERVPEFITVTLVDSAGNTLATVENVPYGTSVETWVQANDALALSDGSTVHEYKWMLPDNTPITGKVFRQDVALTGAAKPLYTVTFLGNDPNGTPEGGSFIDTSAAYTTVQVLEGDTVPQDFMTLMQQNITLQENWIFYQWQYAGDTGYLVMGANTPIVKDTEVWATYTQEAYVRFWKDRTRSEQFVNSGLENQHVGEVYEGRVPDTDAIMAVAPMEGMRFRYWYDLTCGEVFTPGTDKVLHNLDLYPVFERAIFSFVDENGSVLTAQYEGTPLNYDADDKAGMYYEGLEVMRADGTVHVIPNGTEITREYLTASNIPLPAPVDGRFTIQATPVWKPLRTVIYHTGEGAQFIIYGAESSDTYTIRVEDEIVLLGPLDIVNVVSPIGLALDGWSTTPDGDVEFDANATYSGDSLDDLVAEGETVHLYPVWAQQENTIAITFKSNYSSIDGAVDAEGNPLPERDYVVYIKSGYKPTMPTLDTTGIQNPSDLCADGTTLRYELGGWSRDQDGKLTSSDGTHTQTYGSYSVGSEYKYALTSDTTFYAIWVDKEPETEGIDTFFFVTNDGKQPFEPSQYGSGGYLPGGCNDTVGWKGTIKKEMNISNNIAQVEANILTRPEPETILPVLQESDTFKKNFPDIVNMTAEDYGTKWWIEWYGCKYACGKHYHIDGRVRFATQVELNYHPNGGTNPPASELKTKETWATVNKTNKPQRDNFIFLGWDEDPSAKVPDYPVNGGLTEIYMDKDKDLYAIWQPVKITIPMDDDFRGQKYEQTNDGDPTKPVTGNRYQFTIEAIELPEGALPYEKRTATSNSDGSFTFPRIDVQVEGMYVFEVREVIGSQAVQYDAAVYRLTINIVQSDYGLGIAGYSFTRDNKPVVVSGNNVDNVVFKFYNRTDVRNVTVSKVWDDGENQDGLRPGSVDVTLYRRGESIPAGTATLNAVNGWTWTWENLPIKDSSTGLVYEYYVVEDTVPRYGTSYTGDMNSGLVIINTFPPQLADFRVVKVWQDNNAVSQRPETLVYRLTGATPDGAVIINSTSGAVAAPYEYVFDDMPQYYQGERLQYTLTEEPTPGYDASVTSVSDGYGGAIYTVTNTRATTGVTITKQVTGNAADSNATFAFTAHLLGEDGQVLTNFTAGEGYTLAADGTITFTLSHGQSVELAQLPLGSTLVLAEESGTYTASFSPEGTQTVDGMRFEITEDMTITVTNERSVVILTGVTLDTAPYLLLMGLALLGLAGFVKPRKRRAD